MLQPVDLRKFLFGGGRHVTFNSFPVKIFCCGSFQDFRVAVFDPLPVLRIPLRKMHPFPIVGIYRQDVYEIPPDAIRELIINALVHRSYLDHGTIQVAVYDNRLESTSPGKLPMGQTMERMKEGYSKIRNEALAHAFAYMNLIEHWRSGIPRVIDKVKAAGLMKLLGIKQRRTREILVKMVEKGWLRKEGASRSTIYVKNTEGR